MQTEQKEKEQKIVIDEFKNAKTIDTTNVFVKSHSFKFHPAVMKKNVSWVEKKPQFVDLEHCHIFHSYDSYGRKQTRTNAVGGHYHEIELYIENKELKLKVSPPMQNSGSEKIYPIDTHTHSYSYIKSDEFKMRTVDANSMAMVNAIMKPFNDSDKA